MASVPRHWVAPAILVGLLVGAAGYLVATKEAVTTKESEARRSNLLKLWRPDRLMDIQISRDGENIRLLRKLDTDAGQDNLWKLERAPQYADSATEVVMADQAMVDRMLTALEFLFPQRRINKEDVDKAAFGLNEPRFTIMLNMGGKKQTIALGGPAPKPEGSIYVDVDGEVSVVKKEAFNNIDIPLATFRTRAVVPYLSNELSKIELDGEGGKKSFVPRKGLAWRFSDDQEGGSRVQKLAFDRMLEAFADMKATAFPDEIGALSAQKGAATVTLTMIPKDSARQKGIIVLGGACPDHPEDVIVQRTSPTRLVACTAKSVYQTLSTSVESFRDRRITSLRDDEIEELVLEEGEKKLELARKGDGWHQRAPVDADVEGDRAKALVKALASAEAEEISLDASLLGSVTAKITVIGGAGAPKAADMDGGLEAGVADPDKEIIVLGKEDKLGRIAARREQDGVILLLKKDIARSLLPKATSLRSLKVTDHSLERLRKVVVKGEGIDQTLERSTAGVWTLSMPKGYEADNGSASDIGQVTTRIIAERWVSDTDDGTFGLAKPHVVAEVHLDGNEPGAVYKLIIGGQTTGGYFAKIEGQPEVFVVARSVESALTMLAVDKTVSSFLMTDLDSVTLTQGKASIKLVPEGRTLVVPKGGPELSSQRLSAIAETIQNLIAEGVVHLGGAKKEEGFDKPLLEVVVKKKDGKEVKFKVGAGDSYRATSIHYVRKDGVDATYAVAVAKIRTLLDAM